MIQRQRAQQADTGMSDTDQIDAREYRRTLAEVKEQIEYDALDTPHDHERLDEIVEIMTETLCSRRPYVKVAGENPHRGGQEPVQKAELSSHRVRLSEPR